MGSIAIIPARWGSTRIPLKNIRHFYGKPIIAYSIETAKRSNLFDKIVVSADSEEIEQEARRYGAEVFKRSPELGKNEVGTYEVIRECAMEFDYEYVCGIYATSPLMSEYDLKAGYLSIHGEGVYHSISIGYPPLQDAAQFYWSTKEALKNNIGYWWSTTVPIQIDPKRVCDINTEEDWKRAEKMYKDLYETA